MENTSFRALLDNTRIDGDRENGRRLRYYPGLRGWPRLKKWPPLFAAGKAICVSDMRLIRLALPW